VEAANINYLQGNYSYEALFNYIFHGWDAYMSGSPPNMAGTKTLRDGDTRPYEWFHPTPISTTLGQYKSQV
jgi:hypothetical protein